MKGTPRLYYGLLGLILFCGLVVFGGIELGQGGGGTFMPHANCYMWNKPLIILHVSSDLLIGLSYIAISSTLAYLVAAARRHIPFHWMILAFGISSSRAGARI